MPFTKYLPLAHDGIRIRGYVHSAWLDDDAKAERYALEIAQENEATCRKYDFLIFSLWSYHSDRIADVFGFSDMPTDRWPGNPDVSAWVMRNGVFVPRLNLEDNLVISCGDTIRMLGREEELRASSSSLADYLQRSNPLGLPAR